MKRKSKLLLNYLLVVIYIVCAFGCNGKVYLTTGLDADQLLKVSGEVVPISIGKLILATQRNNYQEELGEEIWKVNVDGVSMEEKLKEVVKLKLAELKTISMLAKEKNILLSNSEKENISKAAEAYYGELTEEEKESLGITKEDIYTLYEYFRVSEKLYDLTVNSADVEISDEEARVIKVQYCFVKTYYIDENNNEIELDEDGKAAAENRIHEAYTRLQSGTDFSVIAKEYSDDTIYEYEFGRGEMEKNFEDAAFQLENGGISEIITGEKGFYIIKCINSYDELKTEENKRQLLEEYKNKAFMDMYEPFLNKQTYEYNDKEYNSIDINSLILDNSKLYEIYSQYVEE